MDKEKLVELLKRQLRYMVEIRSYSRIWLEMHNLFQAEAEYNDVYRISPYFWSITLENFQHRFLLDTAKLFDESGECLSVKKIINICEQNQKLFPKQHKRVLYCHSTDEIIEKIVQVDIEQVIKEAKEKYASVAETREKLFTLRDKDLAHFDKKYVLDLNELYTETALNREKFEELLCIAETILNNFLSALTDMAVSTIHCDAEDYKELLIVAKKGFEDEYLSL